MDIYEALVLRHLTRDPNVFVRWQHSIPNPEGKEWSCPDFVALDISKKRVAVVEVSSAYDIRGLIDKVNRCDHQWLDLLRLQLEGSELINSKWDYGVEIFVRKDSFEKFGSRLNSNPKLHVTELEKVGFPWQQEASLSQDVAGA